MVIYHGRRIFKKSPSTNPSQLFFTAQKFGDSLSYVSSRRLRHIQGLHAYHVEISHVLRVCFLCVFGEWVSTVCKKIWQLPFHDRRQQTRCGTVHQDGPWEILCGPQHLGKIAATPQAWLPALDETPDMQSYAMLSKPLWHRWPSLTEQQRFTCGPRSKYMAKPTASER